FPPPTLTRTAAGGPSADGYGLLPTDGSCTTLNTAVLDDQDELWLDAEHHLKKTASEATTDETGENDRHTSDRTSEKPPGIILTSPTDSPLEFLNLGADDAGPTPGRSHADDTRRPGASRSRIRNRSQPKNQYVSLPPCH